MLIEKVYLEELKNGKVCLENQSLHREAVRRALPAEFFTEKRIHRRQLPLSPQTLVAGYIPTVLSALKQLRIPPPPTNDYPRCLEHLLYRRMWTSSVRYIRDRMWD